MDRQQQLEKAKAILAGNNVAPVGTSSFKDKYKQATAEKPIEQKPSLLKSVARGIVKPFARTATNLVNAGQIATGNKPTQPFSGNFLGEVKPVGQEGTFGQQLKDTLGVGLELGSNFVGGEGAVSVAKNAGKGLLKQSALRGVTSGATAGGTQALGTSLQNDDSLKDTAINTAEGTAIGGVIGGALGTLGGAIGRKSLPKTTETMDTQSIVDMTGDVLNKRERTQAIKEGRGVSETLFNKGALQASDKDIARANLVKDVLTSKDLNTNISNATSEIKNISQNVVEPFLDENPYPYDPQDLSNYLKIKVTPSDSIKLDKKAFSIYNTIKGKAMKLVMEEPPTTKGILTARKKLDSYIKKEFGDTVYEAEQKTALKKAPIEIRNAFNDFVSDSLKFRGNIAEINKIDDLLQQAQARGIKIDNIDTARQVLQEQLGVAPQLEDELKAAFFKHQMKKMHALYESVDNMATRQEAKMNKSVAEQKLKQFKSDNPIKTKVVNTGIKATVVGNLIK